jgi:hypothetical protein
MLSMSLAGQATKSGGASHDRKDIRTEEALGSRDLSEGNGDESSRQIELSEGKTHRRRHQTRKLELPKPSHTEILVIQTTTTTRASAFLPARQFWVWGPVLFAPTLPSKI